MGRIFPCPFFLKRRSSWARPDRALPAPVNRAQIDRDGLAVLSGAEVQGMTHQPLRALPFGNALPAQ